MSNEGTVLLCEAASKAKAILLDYQLVRIVVSILQFLGNLRSLRDSHDTVKAGSSETVGGEPSSVARIISECESALTLLNRDLGILTTSIARKRGELSA